MRNKKSAIEHLMKHQTYPASKEEMVKACNELSDFSEEDKKWFTANLPKGTYRSADQVIGVLGLM